MSFGDEVPITEVEGPIFVDASPRWRAPGAGVHPWRWNHELVRAMSAVDTWDREWRSTAELSWGAFALLAEGAQLYFRFPAFNAFVVRWYWAHAEVIDSIGARFSNGMGDAPSDLWSLPTTLWGALARASGVDIARLPLTRLTFESLAEKSGVLETA